MSLVNRYFRAFQQHADRRAFRINDKDYTYRELLARIEGCRKLMQTVNPGTGARIGVVCFDMIETYASIFASWFSGCCFVPINPRHPKERNMESIRKTGVKIVISGKANVSDIVDSAEVELIVNSNARSNSCSPPVSVSSDQLLYILTTSGSTGTPKYVPVNMKNVEAYCDGFLQLFPELDNGVRFLQTYDLTSDAAFTGYLLPLLTGACVFTLPDDQFKFLSIAKLMANKEVNWVKFTPSVLSYLSPYRSKLDLQHLQFVVFGGEALPLSLLKDWAHLFPEATIVNLYGPTETTISSFSYRFKEPDHVKENGGVISIGRPFPEVEPVLIDGNAIVNQTQGSGELAIAGAQTMTGYLNGNANAFFVTGDSGAEKKYYLTGDMVTRDDDGFYYFMGRRDDQVKVNGYRVSLLEVENTVRGLIPGVRIAAVIYEKTPGFRKIFLFLEGYEGDTEQLKMDISRKLPLQMVPDEIICVAGFPMTTSGKIDKVRLVREYL